MKDFNYNEFSSFETELSEMSKCLSHPARVMIISILSKHKDLIIETDDDNFPKETFWKNREREPQVLLVDDGKWVNVYKYFTQELNKAPVERLANTNSNIK